MTATISRSPRARLLQVADVTGVQEIETAVGHHDTFAVGARVGDCGEQFRLADHTVTGIVLLAQHAAQVGYGDGRGTELAHHDPGRQVGQCGRLRQRQPRRQPRREGRDHRVTGAGHVENLACPRRQVHRGLPRSHQAHPILATGDQQCLDPAVVDQGLGTADQIVGIGAAADHGLEFRQIGGDHGRTAVDREIPPLGVDQHRDTGLAGGLDQHMGSAQRALAIIREDHRRRTLELRSVQRQQVARLQAGKIRPRSRAGSVAGGG